MLRICAYWEALQMGQDLDWRIWRQLRGAFNVDEFHFAPVCHELSNVAVYQWDTMAECLAHVNDVPRVFLEPDGDACLADLRPFAPDGMTLVVGSTEHTNGPLVQAGDLAVRIETPGVTDMYGHNAAAIALAHWWGCA